MELPGKDKKAVRRAMWAAFARVLGVILAAGAGPLIKTWVGDGSRSLIIGLTMAFVAWTCIWYAEYEREKDDPK